MDTPRRPHPNVEARLQCISVAAPKRERKRAVALNQPDASNLISAHFAQADGQRDVARAMDYRNALQEQELKLKRRKVEALERLVNHWTNV